MSLLLGMEVDISPGPKHTPLKGRLITGLCIPDLRIKVGITGSPLTDSMQTGPVACSF